MTVALLTLDAQLLDGLTFFLVAHGREFVIGRGESNPLIASLGLSTILTIKAIGIIALVVLAWRLRGRRIAWLPGVMGMVGAISNLWALA